METRIKSYEKYIKEAAKHPSAKLLDYHNTMVKNFQHERSVHLATMLFFVVLTLAIAGLAISSFIFANGPFTIVALILTLILIVLTFFYVKHYYFLENHIQKLYDVTKDIYEKLDKKQ